MPRGTPEEQAVREAALADATGAAIEVPLGVLEACPETLELCLEIGEIGLQASRSDAGVGAQMAHAAGAGAYQNVCINLPGLTDRPRGQELVRRADAAFTRVQALHEKAEATILAALRAAAGA